MSTSFDPSLLPSDITLMLRADAERSWLHREVIPVLRQVESRELLSEEEVGAALAYLEMTWTQATARAHATDAAFDHLHARDGGHNALTGSADRYHTFVRALRKIVAERITPFVEPTLEIDQGLLSEGLRVMDARGETQLPQTGGCAPRAA
ncbi:MAG TPA: hypothetical protein VGI26_04515 [Solirubrobacteraceae bacterium]